MLNQLNETTFDVTLGDSVYNKLFGSDVDKPLPSLNGGKWTKEGMTPGEEDADEAWVNLNIPAFIYQGSDHLNVNPGNHWLFGNRSRVELITSGVCVHTFDLNPEILEVAIEFETKPGDNVLELKASYSDLVTPARQGVVCETPIDEFAQVIHPRYEGAISFLGDKVHNKYKNGGFKDLCVFECIRKSDGARMPCSVWELDSINANESFIRCSMDADFVDSCFTGSNDGMIVMGWGDTLGDSGNPPQSTGYSVEGRHEYMLVSSSYHISTNGTADTFHWYGDCASGATWKLLGGIHSSPSSTSPDGGSIHEEGDAEMTITYSAGVTWQTAHSMPGSFEIQASTDYWLVWAADRTAGSGNLTFGYHNSNSPDDLHRETHGWTTGTSLTAASSTSSVGDFRQGAYITTSDVSGGGGIIVLRRRRM